MVANRGEIACRVIRACRSLGYHSIAVCSDADANSMHVELADEARNIGSAVPSESYLNIDRLIDAARQSRAGAVHPGYGFLSESPEFAAAVIGAGLTWIGPDPETIRTMGNKSMARNVAREAGVPVIPGSGALAGPRLEDVAAISGNPSISGIAAAVGYPLLVKAAAGGGGIGMQCVNSEAGLAPAVARTQAQALRSFGDGSVYLERFLPVARHIEVQVLGDGAGGAIHLFERDCSLQRRFQKVMEESPAPRLSQATRDGLLNAAVRLAQVQHYKGPGTVEFIVDAQTQEFFFLEMNTRIQVEHAVTEMVTGIDIVALQMEIANGIPLGLRQADVVSKGHSFECRLYAEDPAKNFRPSTGTLTLFRLPAHIRGSRIESGYREGDVVTPYYDPLLAKLLVHADDRDGARVLMSEVLARVEIGGVKTNLPLLRAVMQHPAFMESHVHTRWLENEFRSAQAPGRP